MSESRAITNSPFLIGVSGHRNPHPHVVPHLKARIAQFFEQLKACMPHSELRIIVGMAQGADLLVAQVAVDAGLSVDALLPMPLEQYLTTFDSSAAAQLGQLLGHPAVHCTELTKSIGDSADVAHYTHLTQTLIAKSSLLLALWDGAASRLPGGTADTVLSYLGARTRNGAEGDEISLIDSDAEPAKGPNFVYWVPTPRDDADAQCREPRFLSGIGEHLLAVHRRMPHELAQQIEALNEYNADYLRMQRRGHATSQRLLVTPPAHLTLAKRGALEQMEAEYAKADALAVHYQTRSNRLFRCFSYMACAMALLFLVYAKFAASSFLLSLYLGILAVSLGLYYWARRKHWFSKHLLYRVLAETLRTKFCLHMANADRQVNAVELIKLTSIDQFPGFSWIGMILKNVQPLHANPSDTAERESVQWVQQHWILDQQSYFRRRVYQLERTRLRLERTKSALLFLITGLMILLITAAPALASQRIGPVPYKDLLVFLMGLLSVWLGVWELYQNKMSSRELLWQYRNQLNHFSRAELQLADRHAPDRQEAILAELGKESLMETYLWTIHRYHREHEPPSAA